MTENAVPDTSTPDIEVEAQPACFHLHMKLDMETERLVCQRCGQAFVAEGRYTLPSDNFRVLRAWAFDNRAVISKEELIASVRQLIRAYDQVFVPEDRLNELTAENAALRKVLEPFAKAAKEVPDGVRSTLRIWIDIDEPLKSLSATTDHLYEAARLLGESDGQP